MTISVLVVDDQAMVRAGFAAILGAQPDIEVVGQAADGDEAIALAATLHPAVILMDVRMPGRGGIEATQAIRAGEGDVPYVLMLTTFDADEYVHEALAAGASGFLLKDAAPADLIAAVRVIAAGDALLAPSVTRRLLERFHSRRPVDADAVRRVADLTEREREILVLIGRGLSNAEIAAELVIAGQTVKSHVSRIFAKLELRDRVHAVILAYDAGLVEPA